MRLNLRSPWGANDPIRYAALESGGRIYGLAREVETERSLRWELLDWRKGEWIRDPEGPAHFTELGGVTDAEPITVEEAVAIEAELLARGRRGE